MTSLIQRLGWSSVAALTADGEKYTDYMASLQVWGGFLLHQTNHSILQTAEDPGSSLELLVGLLQSLFAVQVLTLCYHRVHGSDVEQNAHLGDAIT